jgi:uncharacterized protein YjbI with pentapeptide repeats
MNTEELKQALELHKKWLLNHAGCRADLSWTDLSEADLSEADLSRANLSCANLSGANLSRANLSEADLSDVNLSCANLSRADLSRADLSRANLSWADLTSANLSWANLSGADLCSADLSGANLSWADLYKANLSEANLSEADLYSADLSRVNLSGADLSEANLSFDPPKVENIDTRILEEIKSGGVLDMSTWHICVTTHCRAGWATHLAGPDGKLLEEMIGTGAAAALIYNASRNGKRVPDFFATKEEAMKDIEECAKLETVASSTQTE